MVILLININNLAGDGVISLNIMVMWLSNGI